VGRKDDDDALADLDQQVVEAISLLRVEAGSRLVDDDQRGTADQRLRNAEALPNIIRTVDGKKKELKGVKLTSVVEPGDTVVVGQRIF
jgi:hypothetical protein